MEHLKGHSGIDIKITKLATFLKSIKPSIICHDKYAMNSLTIWWGHQFFHDPITHEVSFNFLPHNIKRNHIVKREWDAGFWIRKKYQDNNILYPIPKLFWIYNKIMCPNLRKCTQKNSWKTIERWRSTFRSFYLSAREEKTDLFRFLGLRERERSSLSQELMVVKVPGIRGDLAVRRRKRHLLIGT